MKDVKRYLRTFGNCDYYCVNPVDARNVKMGTFRLYRLYIFGKKIRKFNVTRQFFLQTNTILCAS